MKFIDYFFFGKIFGERYMRFYFIRLGEAQEAYPKSSGFKFFRVQNINPLLKELNVIGRSKWATVLIG